MEMSHIKNTFQKPFSPSQATANESGIERNLQFSSTHEEQMPKKAEGVEENKEKSIDPPMLTPSKPSIQKQLLGGAARGDGGLVHSGSEARQIRDLNVLSKAIEEVMSSPDKTC